MTEAWKVLRPPRAAALTAAAIVAVAIAACAPAEHAAGPRAELADGAAGSARVVTLVHVMRPGALVASVGYADTTTVPVVAAGGSAGIDVDVLLGRPVKPTNPDDERLWSVARTGAAMLEVARDDRRPTAQGSSTRRVRLSDGRLANVELRAEGGAPVSRRIVRVGGEIVLSEEASWQRVDGVWRLRRRTMTAFAGGRAVGWVETSVETSALRTASRAEVARRALASAAGRAAVAVADAVGPAPLYAQSDEVGSGPCAKQQEAADDAYSDFMASGALFAVSILGTPVAMAAATINLLRAAHRVDVADARMDACVASA
jgi:hypothetical protein